jgi:hypothetical protein
METEIPSWLLDQLHEVVTPERMGWDEERFNNNLLRWYNKINDIVLVKITELSDLDKKTFATVEEKQHAAIEAGILCRFNKIRYADKVDEGTSVSVDTTGSVNYGSQGTSIKALKNDADYHCQLFDDLVMPIAEQTTTDNTKPSTSFVEMIITP